MRKIIQISESLAVSGYARHYHISALCDDGTVWSFDRFYQKWDKLPDIPQDEEAQDESV